MINKSAAEVLICFLKLGVTSFGGPVAHIGFFRREFVERRCWLTETQFAQLLAICQFLPGPASSQLGFAVGMHRAGWLGGIIAFIAFTMPAALLMFVFACLMPDLSSQLGQSIIGGLKLVAVVIVGDAVVKMGRNLCPDIRRKMLAALAAMVAIFFDSQWSHLIVIFAGALIGWFYCVHLEQPKDALFSVSYSRLFGLGSFVIFVVVLILLNVFSHVSALVTISKAFYETGALVFGGGHVVLPLLEHQVVATNWVTQEYFLSGYGAAQAIPGPLFSFAAYLGAGMANTFGPVAGALVATISIFLPGFLLLVAALPYWRLVTASHSALRVVAGINAAVVGLLMAALVDPIIVGGISSGTDIIVALLGFLLLTVLHKSPVWIVVWCVSARVAVQWL